jgi:hypothetical protein
MTKPDIYDGVLWWSFSFFYVVGFLTVASWVFEYPLRVTVAGLVATGLAYIGAWHAREIHVNNRLPAQPVEAPKFFDPRDTSN